MDDVTEDAFKAESGKTNVSLTIASVAGKQRIFTLTCLAHEIKGVKVAQKKMKTDLLPEAREEGKRKLGTSCSVKPQQRRQSRTTPRTTTQVLHLSVSQTTLSDFSKNLEEPSPTEKEEAIDDQTRSMDSHAVQCEKEYWSDLRADTGTLVLPGKIVWNNTIRHLLRVNPGAKRQRAPDSKSQLAIRSMTKTRSRQSFLVDTRACE